MSSPEEAAVASKSAAESWTDAGAPRAVGVLSRRRLPSGIARGFLFGFDTRLSRGPSGS